MKKILALILTALMLVGMVAAIAEAPTNNVTLDKTVKVTGLDKDDSVAFYQLIKWVDGEGWAWNDGVETAATSAGVTLPELTVITGKLDTSVDPAVFTAGVISVDNAAILAKTAVKLGAMATKVADASGEVVLGTESDPVATGLYCALVTPATADTLYNPIFVSADFSQKDSSPNSQEATLEKSYSPAAMAKKETIHLDKDVTGTANGADEAGENWGNTKYDVDIGDVIDFSITSKVPAFSAAYQNPIYEIHDNWEEGLAEPTDVVVTIGGAIATEDTDYTYTADTTNRTFTVKLTATKLAAIAADGLAQDIEITYKSAITSLENATVTEKYNEAEVKFSNNPGDSSKYSLLEDKTRNYTFSIDASLLGYTGGNYWTDELIKTGLDEQGNLLTKTETYHSATKFTELSPLQGAEFALFKTAPTADEAKTKTDAQNSGKLYTNKTFNGFVTSDKDGRLNITGLDCGTYYLKELSAPAGFIKDNRLFTITIEAKYTSIPATYYYKNSGTQTPKDENDILVKVGEYKVLDDYRVVVTDNEGNSRTSTYNIVNDGPVNSKKVTKAEWEALEGSGDWAGDNVTPINNTKGTELPSTGGMGTTILYIGGSILVLAAVILLVTKRRMKVED